MDYFLLRQDRSIANTIKPLGIEPYKKIRDFEDLTVLQIARQSQQQYLDLLESPRTMISDKLKTILSEYNPTAIYKRVVLTDNQSQASSIYWLLELPEFDCIADSCDFRKKSRFEDLILDYKKVKDHAFFVIMSIFEPYLLVNLEVAEKILRADPWGLKLEKIKTK